MAIEHYDEAYRENIRDYLIRRAHAVRVDAKLNLLNLAGLSEDFYAEFLNILLDLQLENANAKERNKAGIDLIDWKNRVVAQVSATCAPNTIRKKIRNSIEKFKIPEGEPWQFYFVPITDQAPDLKSGFDLPDGLIFDESKDVLDITRIMELAKGIDRLRNLSELADKYGKGEALRKSLDELLLRTWKAHRSYKLMQTDEIDKRLFPNISDSRQFEALGKRTEHDSESPVWSIIRESWNDPTNQPVMIQGKGGIGKTVALFSLTGMDKNTIPAPAVYIPMFELVNRDGKVINLTEYIQSAEFFPSLTPKQREETSILAAKPWAGPSLLVLLDGFNEVPGNQRWNVLQMLRTWHDKNPGAQLIAVSRPMDNLSLETAFGQETVSITLSELTRESVEAYLKSPQGNSVRVPSQEEPIWETIVYPLFLNLYIKTDKLQGQQVWKDYPLDIRDAVGPGSLIWNYLQRELLRHEDDEWILRYAVACEYLAPVLAHHMVRSNDYTVSRRDAVSVIQKALSEMDLERMPSHVAELFSWWGDQTLAMGQPTFLMGMDWPDIVLRESGLLAPYQEAQKKNSGKKPEQRFEFLHQNFRDCLAGVYLVNQAEMAREDEFPEIWGKSQSHAALSYAAELMDPDVYGQLWEANRKAQATGNGKNHTATYNLLELWKRNRNLADELDFSGMDLRGLSLTRCLGKDGPELPLFRKRCLSKKTLLDRSVFESNGHASTINVLAVLPDGRVVSGSVDSTLRVWDAATGQCLQTLKGHSSIVTCVAVLPDGRVVSGSSDNTLRVWDAATGQCPQTLKGHRNSVTCVAVLPDGRVVSGSYGNTLRVWDAATGQCLQTLKGHRSTVTCVAVLPDGRVVSGSYDSTLRVWDAATGKCLQTLEGHRNRVNCVAVLPDGRVVSGSGDNTLRVWDAVTGQCLLTLEGHRNRVTCVSVLPDGRVVSGSRDNTLRVWDAATGQCLQTLEGHSGWVNCVAVLPDGRVVSGSDDHTLRVWDAATGQCLQTLEGHRNSVNCVTVLQDGRVVSGSDDSTLRVWDAATGQCLQTLEGHRNRVTCVSVLPDGRVVSGSDDSTLRVWDAATGQCLQTLKGHSSSVNCVAVRLDGRVVSGSYGNTLRVWDAATGQCLQTLKGHRSPVTCVAVLPDGRVVSGSYDSTLRVWDAATGKCLQTLKGHRSTVTCVAVLPDGRVVSGSGDNTLRVWDVKTGICLDVLEATEVRVSWKNEFQMNFSDAMISEDLAPLLWHNGAWISDADYNRWVKPLRFDKSDNLI